MQLNFQNILSELQKPLISRDNLSGIVPIKNGYKTHFDRVLYHFRNKNFVANNKIFDFLNVENDPNFSRSNPVNSKTLDKILSDISVSTSLVTVVSSKLQILGVKEFLPQELNYLLDNLNGLLDSSYSVLTLVKNGQIFKQIQASLFADLLNEVTGGRLHLDELVTIFDNIKNSQTQKDPIKHNRIRFLMGLGLQNLLPRDIRTILNESFQFLDKLDQIFDDESEKNLFKQLFYKDLDTYALINVQDMVTNTAEYEDVVVNLDDPLGISLQNRLYTEIENYTTNYIDNLDYTDFGTITNQDILQIKNIALDFILEDIQTLIYSKVTAPLLTQAARAVENNTYNLVLESILQTETNLANYIIENMLGIGLPQNPQNSMDYLINVRNNLLKREEILNRGDSLGSYYEVDNFIRNVINKNNFTEKEFKELLDKIKKLSGV